MSVLGGLLESGRGAKRHTLTRGAGGKVEEGQRSVCSDRDADEARWDARRARRSKG